MQVSFTKVDDKRYSVAIERLHGPALVPRFGPGNDDLMPHDLAHFVVEEHFEIALGVWGQLAAGGGGIFTPAPDDNSLAAQRRVRRIGAIGREDMIRSEQLVVVAVAAWESSIGRVRHQIREVALDVDADALRGAVDRLDQHAGRWHALEHGGSLDLVWPRKLTFDVSKSRMGRRHTRRTPSLSDR